MGHNRMRGRYGNAHSPRERERNQKQQKEKKELTNNSSSNVPEFTVSKSENSNNKILKQQQCKETQRHESTMHLSRAMCVNVHSRIFCIRTQTDSYMLMIIIIISIVLCSVCVIYIQTKQLSTRFLRPNEGWRACVSVINREPRKKNTTVYFFMFNLMNYER